MRICYLLAIRAYWIILNILAGFHDKARLMINGRRGIFEAMEKAGGTDKQPLAWFHCASLGEFEQARPVLEGFRIKYSHYKILLTFFSPSGYEVRKAWPGADYIFYLPADTPQNAEKLVSIFKPEITFFVKYEFWYFYLSALAKSGAKIILFSAIFRPSQIFFKPWGHFFARMLGLFTHIFVQNQESEALLKALGLKSVSISGDTRFDRVSGILTINKEIPIAGLFKSNKPLLLIGSAWTADTDFVIPVLNQLQGRLKVIIAPHEIEKDYIAKIQDQFKGKSEVWSVATEASVSDLDLLIIDNIGMLSALYRYADMAWVGGAFGKGLHNTLEAAVWGIPVMFGTRHQKFQEAIDLIHKGGAFTFQPDHSSQLFARVSGWLENPEERLKAGAICQKYVMDKTGATEKILNQINYWIG